MSWQLQWQGSRKRRRECSLKTKKYWSNGRDSRKKRGKQIDKMNS